MNHEPYKSVPSFTCGPEGFYRESNDLLSETPLQIVINGERPILIMCTPQGIQELVIGFLFTEGYITGPSEITQCLISTTSAAEGEQVVEAGVTLSLLRPAGAESRGRRMASYSSCGICGKENYYELHRGLNRVKSRHRFSIDRIMALSQDLKAFQPLYEKTGGAHAAILFDADGHAVLHHEDMGRHNALDKVIGEALVKGISWHDKMLLSSGRASLEMILKAARAGAPLFVALSRPTVRAVEAAKFYNITLVDLAKDANRIYSHARRIEGF